LPAAEPASGLVSREPRPFANLTFNAKLHNDPIHGRQSKGSSFP